ncbi:response regulator transcription factor, partial [Actinomadura rubrisoli]
MKLAVTAPDRLSVRTVEVPDPGDLISRLPHPAALAWVRHGEGIVGWGEAARVPLPGGEDRFAAAARLLDELFGAADIDDPVGVPGSGPVAFGGFGFDPKSPDSVLIVPRKVLGRRGGRAWLTTIDTDEFVAGALRSGAAGFVLKDTDPEHLAHLVRTLAAGG